MNKKYVFLSSRNSIAQEMGWFMVSNLFALAETWGLSVYLANLLPDYMPDYGSHGRELAAAVAHGLGVLLPVFTSYIGHKYLTFRE